MKSFKRLCAAGIVGGTLVFSASAPAAIIYEYVTDQPSYTTSTPGATITVQVYLQETLTAGSPSLINSDGGLLGAGFSGSQTGTLPTNPSTFVLGTSGISGSTGNGQPFAGGFFTVNSDSATKVQGSESGSTTDPLNPNGNATGEILLGDLFIVAGSTPGTTSFILANERYPVVSGSGVGNLTDTATTPYNLDRPSGASPNTGPASFTDTVSNLETFTVTVNSTPEPASLGLLGITAAGLLARRRRRMA